MTDWSHQERGIEMLRQSVGTGHNRPIFQLPTGGGKTRVASTIIRNALRKRKRCLFLAPRRELITQCAKAFREEGLRTGIIMAGHPPTPLADVQVASYQTLHRRGVKDKRMFLPDADIVIVDEAHLSIAKSYQELLNCYSDSIVIGLTATPARGDGRGLGEFYDDIVSPASYTELMDAGVLVRPTYYAPVDPNLDQVKISKGDYVVKDLDELFDTDEQAGDLYTNWKRIAGDKKTVVFCVSIAHALHVCEVFKSKGVKAETISARTPEQDRAGILERVNSGETQVLTNVFIASYGLDIPTLECAVLARPTKNITLFLQTIGRVIRSSPGKTEAIIIDHSGAIKENGMIEDPLPWSLDSTSTVKDRAKKEKEERKEPKEITCRDCGTVFKLARACPMCGLEMIAEGEPMPYYESNLAKIEIDDSKRRNKMDPPEVKEDFFGQLKGYAKYKGYKAGWAAFAYKERYGVWPNHYKNAPVKAFGEEVKNFIKYRSIKAKKSNRDRRPNLSDEDKKRAREIIRKAKGMIDENERRHESERRHENSRRS